MKHLSTLQQTFQIGFMLLFTSISAWAQLELSGRVEDAGSKEGIAGASLSIVGTVAGTITDSKGNFSLSTQITPPFQIRVSSVGYAPQVISITKSTTSITVQLVEQAVLGNEVVVSASRVEESVLKSPVTIEKMDIRAIQSTPAANFYDALRNLKGVDVAAQSLTFTSVNTRGFAGNGNTRVVQMVDGMDNQAPGLSFSVGNVVGLSELDLESVELLPGAASALYGPNATNGLLLMNSKSPFLYQGVSAYVKGGIMSASNRTTQTTPFYDAAIRYAKVFNNKLAFKLNISYLTAKDWQATDTRDQSFGLPTDNSLYPGFNRTSENNPNYNGVNVYGDENSSNVSLAAFRSTFTQLMQLPEATLSALSPQLPTLVNGVKQLSALTGIPTSTLISNVLLPNQLVARTGYNESDLVNYNAQSLKIGGAIHYRITNKVEAILQANWGMGTTVYTSSDRYYIKGFKLGQYKLELKGDNFFVRGYTTQERSGDAYAAGILASYINEAWKPSLNTSNLGESWYPQYAFTYGGGALQVFSQALQTALAGGQNASQAYTTALAAVSANSASLNALARSTADQGRLIPGTAEFNAVADKIKATGIPNGAKFLDRTNLYHVEGMYNFKNIVFHRVAEILVGGNYRVYDLNSQGTLFLQKPDGSEYNIREFGGYAQASKTIADILKLTGSIRYDKNENFKGQWNPRLSGVWTVHKNHSIRASYQTGFRIPTAQNQYINLVTPVSILIGGLRVVHDQYNLSQYADKLYAYDDTYLSNPDDPSKWNKVQLTEFKPERVLTYELGYKGTVGEKLWVDAYYYNSILRNYIGGIVFVNPDNPLTTTRAVSTPANYTKDIHYQGFGIGLDYLLPKGYVASGNLSNTTLNAGETTLFNAEKNRNVLDDGFQVGFNTPKYRYNLSFAKRISAKNNVGFNITYRYQQAFCWNELLLPSQARTAMNNQQIVIPAYGTLDAQVSLKIPQVKTILKLGGSNILNKAYTTAWGNPQIGAMYYIGLNFDQLMN
ncbi:MAG: TonB-dependent receptor [Siphonobacter sp.]